MVLADIACDALEFTVSQRTEERHALESLDRRHLASLTRAESTVPPLELTLLLAEGEDARYERAALRWHTRFVYETKN
jgi:hypothetical protein